LTTWCPSGVSSEEELEQWLALTQGGSPHDAGAPGRHRHDRKELAHNFCRSCGYCLPCAVGIDIPAGARMSALLRRSPYQQYMSDEWYEKMHRKIRDCASTVMPAAAAALTGWTRRSCCGLMLADYNAFYAVHHGEKLREERHAF
jgi:predicted aldo/keto reductase-like oxidoreductase